MRARSRPDDYVACTYRGHGHALALGLSPEAVIGEICGRTIGCAGGLGGSMHLVEPSVGLLPTAAIVGAGLPIACGVALAAKLHKSGRVAVSVFGDGTANIGAFHEALNFAAIRKLAVVFVCENNLYGEYTRIDLTTPIENIADRASGYAMPGAAVDGQDVDAVAAAMDGAVARARAGLGPTLLEMKTYRFSGHSRSDPATYRPAGELDAWLAARSDQTVRRCAGKGRKCYRGRHGEVDGRNSRRCRDRRGASSEFRAPRPHGDFRPRHGVSEDRQSKLRAARRIDQLTPDPIRTRLLDRLRPSL